MADELYISGVSVRHSKGGITISSSAPECSIDISNNEWNRARHNVGTSEELMQLGSVDGAGGKLGYCLIYNYDLSNYVSVLGSSGGSAVCVVPASGWVLFHFPSSVTAPYLKANGSACNVEYFVAEK